MSIDVNVDYLASDSWDERMHERMRWLRDNAPVYWAEKNDLWVLSRFEDVSRVSKDQELYTSADGVRPRNPAKLALIDEGEPRHTQLRNLINRGFTPRMVRKLERTFLEITTDAIDAIASVGECDFVQAIAVPLPLLLIAEMIGIRKEDRGRFHEWSDAMIAAEGNFHRREITAAASRAFLEYSAYVTEIIEDRRRHPRDDLVTILTGARDDGVLGEFDRKGVAMASEAPEEQTRLANDELIMLCVLLLVAGNETTRNAISGGMQLLIEHPDQRRRLIDDPDLIPGAVEEMLRLVSPVHSFARRATRDTELRGTRIRAGDWLLMLYPSANRDASVFEDPDAFLVDRVPQHLAFGIGKHFCLGANLARMEMRVAFRELLRRLPDMEYAGAGPEIVPSALVRSCVRMPVSFTPELPEPARAAG